MGQAAVPSYIDDDFKLSPPGHRFGLYFPFWQPDNWQLEPDPKSGEDKTNRGKYGALSHVLPYGKEATAQIQAILERQRNLVDTLPAIYRLQAKSTAPFMTGTGIEHPLENGFAFLNPYGLPYLPGSSIKGVLRRAAEEMAGVNDEFTCDNPAGWTKDAINALFGKECPPGNDDCGRNRGALCFWDVYPRSNDDKLMIEIMTPHYSLYYQGRGNPSDDGQPNPILFLAMPPGSLFTFHVQCQETTLSGELLPRWQVLLEAAFKHAFDWLGFGAKTAVGYGALAPPVEPGQEVTQPSDHTTQRQDKTFSANQQQWEHVTLRWEPGSRTIVANASGKTPARLGGAKVDEFLNTLPKTMRDRLMKKKEIKNITLVLEVLGNQAAPVRFVQTETG